MLKLGIIGSDNSHSYSIADACNRLKRVPLRVTHLWGESPESARIAAERGNIPHLVSDWRELVGQVDGVMIDHRDGADHYEPARFFIENRVPTFVDKPLANDLARSRELLSLAARKKTPVCTFGLLPLQSAFQKFLTRVRSAGPFQAVHTTGPADIDSPHGGIFFYGFHQVDVIVEMLGTEVESAQLQRHGRNGIASIQFFGGRMATMHCLAEKGHFHWMISGDKGIFTQANRFDLTIYLPGVRKIYEFLASGQSPWSRSRMLAPIAILEALQKSLKTGTAQRVGRFS